MGEACLPLDSPSWWKSTTIYQIWPASYKDSSGNGIGDLQGIISTLPYLHSLGVETIWLSPMYKSPQRDMGYDISDYEDIHEGYGTLADMMELIDGIHELGMRIVLDLVINHTSDEHVWFRESRRGKKEKRADWYMWKEGKIVDGKRVEPNNWKSVFGGSAWEWCEERQEYYLHIFDKSQPDLNWENEETRKAIYDSAIRFWLDRGVDGWRIDTCNIYSKVPGLPDAPITDPSQQFQNPVSLIQDGPRIHEYLRELRSVCDEYGDKITVGELGLTQNRRRLLKYVDAPRRELSEVFEFSMLGLGRDFRGYQYRRDFGVRDIEKAIAYSQGLIEGTQAWTTTFCENHDSARSISRFTTRDEAYHVSCAKLLATLTASLSGTLFLYQGQEIGMTNIPPSWGPEEYKDVEAQNFIAKIKKEFPGNEEVWRKAMEGLNQFGRDNARTPVQWDTSRHAGFTPGDKPWMRVNENYRQGINVAEQVADSGSIVNYWRRMLVVRKQFEDIFVFGKFLLVSGADEKLMCYWKIGRDGGMAYVVLNWSAETVGFIRPKDLKLLIGNVDGGEYEEASLKSWEARIYISK